MGELLRSNEHQNLLSNQARMLMEFSELDPRIPQLIVLQASRYLVAYQRWETVRQYDKNGFGGYLVGRYTDPVQATHVIAETTQNGLDSLVKQSPSNQGYRKQLEQFLFGKSLTNVIGMQQAELLFLRVKDVLVQKHLLNAPLEQDQKNAVLLRNVQFKEQVQRAVARIGQPSMEYQRDQGKLSITMPLPKDQLIATTLGNPLNSLGFGHEFAKELGIVGAPIIRTILENPMYTAWLHVLHPNGSTNYAFRGSTVRESLKADLIKQIAHSDRLQ